jgi:hypothetical protein
MPVDKTTSRRVLSLCMIAGGGLFALVFAALCGMIFAISPLRGAGNPLPEDVRAGVHEDRVGMVITSGLSLIGFGVVAWGLKLWPRSIKRAPGDAETANRDK